MTDPVFSQRCPECGAPLDCRESGATLGHYCTHCNWSVVTTHPAAMAKYAVRSWRIQGVDPSDKAALLAIAALLGIGALEVRRRISAGHALQWLANEHSADEMRARLQAIDPGISITLVPASADPGSPATDRT